MDNITIPIWRWLGLMHDLRCASEGKRESGAFLLGRPGFNRVIKYVMYNTLDPHVSDSGVIVFRGGCISPLWEMCRNNGLRVIADVHSHPKDWTGQSPSDQANPMIAQSGHIALIVPRFAARYLQGLKNVGIHEYLGNKRWKNWELESRKIRLVIL